MKSKLKMNFKYDPYTNPKHNFPVNQLLSLNVLGCDCRKHVQNTSPKTELFETYEGVQDFGWCRLGLTDVELTPKLSKP